MRWRSRLLIGFVTILVVAAFGGYWAHRAYRVYNLATDWRSEVRYLIESGGTIGEKPASETFSTEYLEAIFGSEPEVLEKLKSVVSKGLSDDPGLNLGEVAAMVVTYHKDSNGQVRDVVAHVMGGFQLGQRKPGFHRDGFFAHQLDKNLWQSGNSMLAFLGRDIVIFAEDESREKQQEIIDSILSGEIVPLAESLADPMYFTAVFPDPSKVVPPQLKKHIQAIILKGYLSHQKGGYECIVLTPDSKSASYALTMVEDIQKTALVFLRAKWGGRVVETAWGPMVDPWWAFEWANTIEKSTIEKRDNLVRSHAEFERVMVNAVMKTMERMGRDMAQMRGSLDEKLDPRLVDANLRSDSPLNYWSSEHQWGPNWPIGAPATGEVDNATSPAIEQAAPAVTEPL